jgi:nicotinate-nucleotide pyrophosphorylase (carboxylating)
MNPIFVRKELERFLLEDLGHVEMGPNHKSRVEAFIEIEEDCVVCGLGLIKPTFDLLAPGLPASDVHAYGADGDSTRSGERPVSVCLPPNVLKHGIRTALNLLQHLSGIATNTAKLVERIEGSGCQLLDTRKTTPGLRAFEKYAVRVGGGKNHRFNRMDGVMLKKEDIVIAGGIRQAIDEAVKEAAHLTAIEVEVESMRELLEVIADGRVRHVLLDNMGVDGVSEAVDVAAGRVILEASGVQTSELERYANTGVPFISTSALIREARPIKMHLVMGK